MTFRVASMKVQLLTPTTGIAALALTWRGAVVVGTEYAFEEAFARPGVEGSATSADDAINTSSAEPSVHLRRRRRARVRASRENGEGCVILLGSALKRNRTDLPRTLSCRD